MKSWTVTNCVVEKSQYLMAELVNVYSCCDIVRCPVMNPGSAAMFSRTDELPSRRRRKIDQWLSLIREFDPIGPVVCATTRTVATTRESAIVITQVFSEA